MSQVGHPDWQPVYRGYAGALFFPDTAIPITVAQQQVTTTLLANTLYDVNVVEVLLPPNFALLAWAVDDVGQTVATVQDFNLFTGPEVVHLPMQALGGNLVVGLTNHGSITGTPHLAVRGYNGVNLPELRMPPTNSVEWVQNLAAGAIQQGNNPRASALYDRVAWVVEMDQPFSVIAQRASWIGITPRLVNEVVGTSGAAGAVHGEMMTGGVGLALGVRNDGAVPASGTITTRATYDH